MVLQGSELSKFRISYGCKVGIWWNPQSQRKAGYPSGVIVVEKAEQFNILFKQHLRPEVAGCVFGFDCEYCSSSKQVAIVQISNWKGVTLICQVLRWGILPPQLTQFLESDQIIKLGVAVENDCRGLRSSFSVSLKGWLDIRHIVKRHPQFRSGNYSGQQDSLKRIARQFFHLFINERPKRSNWSCHELSAEQIQYAASDSQVALDAFLHTAPIVLGLWPTSAFVPSENIAPASAQSDSAVRRSDTDTNSSVIDVPNYSYILPDGVPQLSFESDALVASELLRMACVKVRPHIICEPYVVKNVAPGLEVSFIGVFESSSESEEHIDALYDCFMQGWDDEECDSNNTDDCSNMD